MNSGPELGLMDWVIRWCSRPELFLLAPSDRGVPDIANLSLLGLGFEGARAHLDPEGEWQRFTLWAARRYPSTVAEGLAWIGDALLLECAGDQLKAIGRMKELAEEYLASLKKGGWATGDADHRPARRGDTSLKPFPKLGLMEWIIRWCARAGMFLPAPSDRGVPDFANLLLLVKGFEFGREHEEQKSEWHQFTQWIGKRHPSYFREGSTWVGERILQESGGDHLKAAERMKTLAEEYIGTLKT